MKKTVQKTISGLLCLFFCLSITGCGGADKMSSITSSDSAAYESYASVGAENQAMVNGMSSYSDGYTETYTEEYEEAPMEEAMDEAAPQEAGGTGESKNLENTVASNRKLIRRVNLDVETQDFDGLTRFIEDQVNQLGGYMEESSVYGGNYEYSSRRSAQYTVRVPVDKLDELVGLVGEQGNITHKNESATDVTLSYVDTKSRKEANEVEYERLLALLEKAEDIDTIVALESRMTTVRYEIQSLESQLRTYDNLVDFATIEISVTEVVIYTPTEPEKKTDLERMAEGFIRSVKNIVYDFKEFVIDFVVALPYLMIWAVIIWIVVMIIRKIRKRNKIKKEKKNAERNENRVCDADRKTERGEINIDEPVNRTENSDHIE